MASNSANTAQPSMAGADADAIRQQVERVVGSSSFRASERLRRFLVYVVEEYLAGRANRIKAYNVATEVFGRGVDFDPVTDPIVRIEAGRLRRALEHYYLTAGASDDLRINIPKGGYAPAFETIADASTPQSNRRKPAQASIALVTLRDLGDDHEHAYFVAGLSEELCTALGQYDHVRVVPAFHYDGHTNIRDIGEILDVRFVLDGSVRRGAKDVRVTVRLVETSGGAQVWAGTYDRALTPENMFEIQDEIAHLIVVNIAEAYGGAMLETLTRQSRAVPTVELSAYEAMLRYYHYNQVEGTASWRETREALEHAIGQDPRHAPAFAALAEVTIDGCAFGFMDLSDEIVERATTLLRQALALDPGNCQTYFSSAILYIAKRDSAAVSREAEKILEMNPPAIYCLLAGFLLAVAGEFERAAPLLKVGINAVPGYPPWMHHGLFLDHFKRGCYEDALTEANKFVMPTLIWDRIDRAVALAKLDRIEQARAEIDGVLEMQPDFAKRPRRYVAWYALDEALADEMTDTLDNAGLLG